MKFTILVDYGESQFDLTYSRESEAWVEFWKQVSQMPDDGEALTGFDAEVLASRTGLDGDWRWYVHLMRKAA